MPGVTYASRLMRTHDRLAAESDLSRATALALGWRRAAAPLARSARNERRE